MVRGSPQHSSCWAVLYISTINFYLNIAVSPTVAMFNLVDETTGVAIGVNTLLTFSVAVKVSGPPWNSTGFF